MNLFFLIAFGVFLAIVDGSSQIHDTIYTTVGDDIAVPCVRLLNGDGEIGCGTSSSGVTGVIRSALSVAELKSLISSGDQKSSDIIAVIAPQLFTAENVNLILDSSNVLGIVILATNGVNTTGVTAFSPVNRIPYGSSWPWNKLSGASQPGFMYHSFSKPVFMCRSANCSELFLSRAEENAIQKDQYPLWGAELTAFMYATHDSVLCLSRGFCDPVGGQSVWGSFDDISEQKPLVLVTSHYDSIAFFQQLSVGASADMSGLIALLGAIDALSSSEIVSSIRSAPNQLIFALFTGEAWHNMGSRRFFRDVQNFTCKVTGSDGNACDVPWVKSMDFTRLSMKRFQHVLEVDSVASVTGAIPANLYAHVTPSGSALASTLQSALSADANFSVSELPYDQTRRLPPTAVKSAYNADTAISGAILAAYGTNYDNAFYHSVYDDGRDFDSSALCEVAQQLSRALFMLATGSTSSSSVPSALSVNCTLVSALFDCFVNNTACDLIRRILTIEDEIEEPLNTPTHYAGVWRTKQRVSSVSVYTFFLRNFLSDRMAHADAGGASCKSAKDCPEGELCVVKRCIIATVHFHDSYSLGLEYDYEEDKVNVVDKYEAYTESRWDARVGIRVYRISSPIGDILFLVFGMYVCPFLT